MRREFLPFTRPSVTDAELSEVADALRSGWITSGPRVEAFQKAFAEYVGVPHALAVTSATAGFHMLTLALEIGPGDEVVTPSFTWPSAVNMIEAAGATPVFADVDRHTLQLDPGSVRDVMTQHTKAVIPVHFAGQPSDLDSLRALASERNAILIEDAAHAVGTEYRGQRIGSHGNPAVFSFHAIKNLTTGEGGMITTSSASLAERLISLRFHGVNTDAWRRYAGSARAGYDLFEPGFKYNLTDIQAALGIVQLRRIEWMNSRRTELAALYDQLLAEVPEIERPARVSYPSRSAWHLYQILVDRDRAGLTRDDFREELKMRNVGTGLHFLAVHELTYYREKYPSPPGRLENTEYIARRIVSLPLFPDMTEDDVRQVVDEIRDVVRSRR